MRGFSRGILLCGHGSGLHDSCPAARCQALVYATNKNIRYQFALYVSHNVMRRICRLLRDTL